MLLRLPIDLLNLILPFVADASSDPQWQILSQVHRVLDMRKWCTRIQMKGIHWMSDFNNHVKMFQRLRGIRIESNFRAKSIHSIQNLEIPVCLSTLSVHCPMNIQMKPCLSYCLQRLFLKKVNPKFLETQNLGSLTCCEIDNYEQSDFQFFSLQFAPNLRSLKLWRLSLCRIDHFPENLTSLVLDCKNLHIETLPKSLTSLTFSNSNEVTVDAISQCSQLLELDTLYPCTSFPNISNLTKLRLCVHVPSRDITKQIICANANTLVELILYVDTVDCVASISECIIPNLIVLTIEEFNPDYKTVVSIAWLNGLHFPKLEYLELDFQFNQSQFDTLPYLKTLIVRGEEIDPLIYQI